MNQTKCCKNCLPVLQEGFKREDGTYFCGVPCDCHWPTDTVAKCTCKEQGYPKHKYDGPTKPVQLGGAELFPTTDTSDWEKEFTASFLGRDEFDGVKAFIANELAIQSRRESGAVVSLMESAKQAGRAAERTRLREVIEGMKKEIPTKTGDWNAGDYHFHYDKDIAHNAALNDLLETLKD